MYNIRKGFDYFVIKIPYISVIYFLTCPLPAHGIVKEWNFNGIQNLSSQT
jgi:hypothetical protein